MKQFNNILRFEFNTYLKNKAFIVVTLILVVVMAIVLSFPRITSLFNTDKPDDTVTEEVAGQDKDTLLILNQSELETSFLVDTLSAIFPDEKIVETQQSVEEITEIVETQTDKRAIVISTPTQFQYIAKDVSMQDSTIYQIESVLRDTYRISSLAEFGLTEQQSMDILHQTITGEMVNIGKDSMQSYFYTLILTMLLFIVIQLYGQFVAMSVASEKSSKTMELLVTNANINSLMFGKVIGAGLAGLTQLSVLLLSVFVFFNFNKEFWIDNPIINSIFNMPLDILLYTILFFVLGFFIYAFLFGAVGSFAVKTEDINTLVTPIMLVFLGSFYIVIFSLSDVNSTLMTIASFVPLTSPMAMFARVAMSEVPTVQIVLSVAILFVTTGLTGFFAAKIYKVGVLMYGQNPSLKNICKALKRG